MPYDVFLSVGSSSNEQQEAFIKSLESFLKANDMNPMTLGRTFWSHKQPLQAVHDKMLECEASIILAFERTHLEKAVERRASPREKIMRGVNLPTVWNQIEAAMAYSLDHPLFVIVENGIKDEGLFEQNYDWFVFSVDLDSSVFFEEKFLGIFKTWKKEVERRQARKKLADLEGKAAARRTPSAAINQDFQQDTINVLFLSANPQDTAQLRLDHESRAIDQALRNAEFREKFNIKTHSAVRVVDLQSYLLRHKPNILHFSGHGGQDGIILEDTYGDAMPVKKEALGLLFSVLKDNIRCVMLNACYSAEQAEAIAEHIDCVIGMSDKIDDRAATAFAAAFYQALGFGRDVQTAFNLGCIQIDMGGLEDADKPKLIAKNVDPSTVKFA